jgi:hypothetical protein
MRQAEIQGRPAPPEAEGTVSRKEGRTKYQMSQKSRMRTALEGMTDTLWSSELAQP